MTKMVGFSNKRFFRLKMPERQLKWLLFSALPGGYRNDPNIFEGLYGFTYFWTSTLVPTAQAKSIGLSSYSENAFAEARNRSYANYVRCLKNE